MTDGYKIKRVLVWQNNVEKQIYPAGLQLKLKFDFSVDTGYGDYTYGDVAGSGLIIDNSNGWVTNNNYGNANVYKVVNAKKVWTRILFNFNNISIASNNGGGLGLNSFSNGTGTDLSFYNNTKQMSITVLGTNKSTTNTSISLGTDYYLDFKFEDGVYTGIIYDTSFNEIQKITYTDTSVTSIEKIGFQMWNQNIPNSYRFCRIKKYREAYEV